MDAGTWTISSNKATSASFSGSALLESSLPNVEVFATLSGTGGGGLILRETDVNNRFLVFASTTQIRIYRYIAGASTTILTVGNTYSAGDILSCSVDSSNLFTVKINGVAKGTVTDANHATATKHGLWATNSGGTYIFDDFSITEILALSVPVILNTRRDL